MSSEQTELGYWSCARCDGSVRYGTYTINTTRFCAKHGVKIEWVPADSFYNTDKWLQYRSGLFYPDGTKMADDSTTASSGVPAQEPVLVEAQKLIHGARELEYAPPAKSFLAIADYWTTYLESRGLMPGVGPVLTAIDVANMMILLKVARTMSGEYKRDTYVDIAGYAGCAERVHKES